MLAIQNEEQGHFDQLFLTRGTCIIFFGDRGKRIFFSPMLPLVAALILKIKLFVFLYGKC